jgi:glycosyltransferase involved in cell wall biosynthesis
MKASVIIRSRDEMARLRLTLASLADQPAQIIVVDDGSTDATAAMAGASGMPLTIVRHPQARGRSAAANAGAEAASGDLLIFLDGDTLAAPGMVAAHVAAHAVDAGIVGRGETWHLRCTRLLADPDSGEAWQNARDRVAAMPASEREGLRITREQIRHDFASVARRGNPGIYPGGAPRRLHALEMAALRERAGHPSLWAAASGSNFSVRRDAFRNAGGFDPGLTINEHRELALRLVDAGARMVPIAGARTYHMIHRSGWRDPLVDTGWEDAFRRRHPAAPLDQLKGWWRALSDGAAAADWFDRAD